MSEFQQIFIALLVAGLIITGAFMIHTGLGLISIGALIMYAYS